VPQAMVLSALFFGVAHLSPVIIPAIFALGLVLAYTFQKRGSLAATITAHMTYNLVGFLYLVVQSRH